MLNKSCLFTPMLLGLSFATTANAYEFADIFVSGVARSQEVQSAVACPQRLSPQMAAAFGLPVAHHPMDGCRANGPSDPQPTNQVYTGQAIGPQLGAE